MNEDTPVNVAGGVEQTEPPLGTEPTRRKPKSFKEFAAEQREHAEDSAKE